jgi:hypothetical protein
VFDRVHLRAIVFTSLLVVALAACGNGSGVATTPPSQESMAPESMAPESMAPESMAPESMAPESMAPESMAP